MIKKQRINGISWIDGVSVSNRDVEKTLEKYQIHELDLEACIEGNQRSRIDVYEDYLFLIYHFPRFNRVTKNYELNEFNIFLNKEFLITFRDFPFIKINTLYENYKSVKKLKDEEFKVTPAYILYEITQTMLENMFLVIKNIKIEIKDLETKVFDKGNAGFVKDIMIQKRNIVLLKHMFKPQVMVLKQLEVEVNKMYEGEMEVYFEDLEDKLDQILTDIEILWEYIDSVEDAFKSMIDIKTNFVIKILAIFSAFLLPLTLITSYYGMNVSLPGPLNFHFVNIILNGSIFVMLIVYIYLRKIGKF